MKKALEEAEKKLDYEIQRLKRLIGQVEVGLSADQQKLLLEVLHKTTGDKLFHR